MKMGAIKKPIQGVIQWFFAAMKARAPHAAMKRLVAEIPLGVTPCWVRYCAAQVAHCEERVLIGRLEGSSGIHEFLRRSAGLTMFFFKWVCRFNPCFPLWGDGWV